MPRKNLGNQEKKEKKKRTKSIILEQLNKNTDMKVSNKYWERKKKLVCDKEDFTETMKN